MKHQCPICRRPTDSATEPDFPFCSERCRLIDLGNWAAERYVVSDPLFDEDDSGQAGSSEDSRMSPSTEEQGKPRLALAIATSLGLGYLPKAPGTWGSLAGILIYGLTFFFFPLTTASGLAPATDFRVPWATWLASPVALSLTVALTLALATIGVWAAGRAAIFAERKDPQFVVIDEVSGQHLTYALSLAPLNWKYLLLGFILFRVFDIWKPFPARQAESLPGGLGIMADDWAAGLYAALGLWFARRLGL